MLVSQGSLDDPHCTKLRSYWSVAQALRGEFEHGFRQGPVAEWHGCGQHRVQVFQFLEYVTDTADATVKVFWLDARDRRREVALETPGAPAQPIDFSLERLLSGPWWLRFALARWFPAVMPPDRAAQQGGVDADIGRALFSTHHELVADHRFIKLHRTFPDRFPELNPAIETAMKLGWSRYQALHASSLNRFWPLTAGARPLRGENPQLLALGAAFAMHDKEGEKLSRGDVSGLRLALRKLGLSKRNWARLAREGDASVVPAWQATAGDTDATRFAIATTYLMMRQRLGEDIPPNPLAIRLMLGAWNLPRERASTGLEPLGRLPDPFFRQACLRAPAHDSIEMPAWLAEVRMIGAWLATRTRAAQLVWARRPWTSLLERAAGAQARELALRDAASAVLACLPPEIGAPEPYRIVPLRTAPAVLEEGWAMRHCVWTYVEAAKAGRVMLWSVRSNERRIATLAIWRVAIGADWHAFDLRGFANAPAPEPLRSIGKQVFERFSAAPQPGVVQPALVA